MNSSNNYDKLYNYFMEQVYSSEVQDEEILAEYTKTRLDSKCWDGYHKEGTKIKGNKRVNNCVEDEENIHKPVRPGILKRQVKGKMTCSKAKALKSKQKNKGNNTAKAAQRFLNYHC